MEDKEIIASKTISGINQADFMIKCTQAAKEGWIMYGNPLTNKNIINQVVVKYKS